MVATTIAGRIVAASIERRTIVVLLALALLVVGSLQLDESEVDVLPEFLSPMVEVQTEALGLSATEVEQLVTVPLEANLLNGIAFLKSIESRSVPGLSSVVMTFEDGTDLLTARQLVQERLTQAHALPNVSRPPAMVQPLSSESRVMAIRISSENLSLIDLSVLARWTIRPRLMGVDGVANVSVWGNRERQLQVHVDPGRLPENDITLLDLVKTTGNAMWVSPLTFLEASTPGAGGFIDGPNQRIGVQHTLAINDAADLASIPIEGAPNLTIGDVADVVEGHQALIGDASFDDEPGLLLVVEKFPWANTVTTTEAVEATMAELAPGMTGVQVKSDLFRPASYVSDAISNLQMAAVAAMILLLVLLFGMFLDWRAALTAAFVLAISVIAAGVVLLLTGTTVNFMVAAGIVLAVSLMIEDIITSVSDARTVHAEAGDDPSTRPRAVATAVVSTRTTAAFALVAVAVLAAPVFAMEGAAGEFLPPIATSMMLGLIAAHVASLTVTPALYTALLSVGGGSAKHGRSALDGLREPFERAMTRVTSGVGVGLIAFVLLAIVAVAAVPGIDRDFVPRFQQTDLLISIDEAPGTGLEATQRVASRAATELETLPGVENVAVHVGRAILSDQIENVNVGELWVNLDPDADYDSTVDAVREVVEGYPGLGQPEVLSYANDRVAAVLQEDTDDTVVRVFGESPDVLAGVADDVATMAEGIDGVTSAKAQHPRVEPGIEIQVDLERAAAFELKPGDVRRAAATLLSGIEVGSYFQDQKVFEVIVWSAPEIRQNVTSVKNLLIDTPVGGQVALGLIADVTIAPNPTAIERDAVSRFIDVVVETDGRDRGDVMDDITAKVRADGLPLDYYVQVLDGRADTDGNRRLTIAVSLAALIAALLIVQAALRSWRLAFLAFLASATALAGGLVAMLVTSQDFSIGTAIGLFAIGGLTLRLALSLLGRYEALQLEEHVELGADLVVRGSGERLTPTLLTLLSVAAVMIPIVAIGSTAGVEIIRPMAITILGGLVTAAVVVLLGLPSIYAGWARAAVPHDALFGASPKAEV